MRELQYFKNSGNPEISVALAGISKVDWISVHVDEPFEISVATMAQNRFDVLPIREDDESIIRCYKTKQWSNYDEKNIEISEITSENRLYYLTHIGDAIKKFARTGRKYFFLDNQMEIIGLVTIGNLNCKHVYLYLYNLVIQLEHAMSDYIYESGVTDNGLIQLFEQRNESINAKDALQRYREDDAKGFDYNFVEYLYLTDLCYIFNKKALIEKAGIEKKYFKSIISKVNDIRTVVAHPNKSLIRNENSVNDLCEAIEGLEILAEKLR